MKAGGGGMRTRVPRLVALAVGLLLGVGAVWKIVTWPDSVAALGSYSVLRSVPTGLLTATGLAVELFVAFNLLHDRFWHRLGLPAAILFLTFTAVVLAWQVTAGGGDDCGCLPFLPRSISWWAVSQNLAAALFLWGLWGVSERAEEAVDRVQPASG